MRYLLITSAVAVFFSQVWAQGARQIRTFQRRPEIESHLKNARMIPLIEERTAQSVPQQRTTLLPPLSWLRPSQDADTVPTASTTLPDFDGDTLLANNAGADLDPNTSTDCHYSFFDSLFANGAWLIYSSTTGAPFFSNHLIPPSNTTPDTLFHIGGGIAERYDIDPCALAGSGNSIYIKGVAAQILNNYNTTPRDCDGSTTTAPTNDDGDGAYTIYYQLLDTVEIIYPIDVGDNRPGTYPYDTLRQVSKLISSIRIGWNSNNAQCVAQVINRLERLDHGYFSTPFEVTKPHSYYVALRYELYTPGLDNIQDTLFALIGPAYSAGELCLTGDTNYVGRNLMLTPAYRQSDASWIGPDEWYPQYFLFADRGYDLNHLLFPIVYEAPGTSGGVQTTDCQAQGQVIRHGQQGFGLPYPNPATDCIHLTLNTPAAAQASFTLYTAEGRMIQRWTRQVSAGSSTVAFDLGAIPAGAYLLQAQTPYGIATFWVNVVK